MGFWILLIAGAVSPYLFNMTLPSGVAVAALPVVAPLALHPIGRRVCVFSLFFLVTTLAINQRIEQRLPEASNGAIHELSGTIASLPETRGRAVHFVFHPHDPPDQVPPKIRVTWYAGGYGRESEIPATPQLHAGERWLLRLELSAPRGRVNFHGSDGERWYFANGIGAKGVVRAGDNKRLAAAATHDTQHLRERILALMAGKAGNAPGFRVLAALATADRRGLLRRDRAILTATGTGHLLAISGLHIGLAATLGFLAGRLGLFLIPAGLRQRVAVWLPYLLAWLAALAYSTLAGFGVSTQRALVMLTVATVVMLARRSVHPMQAWLVAMALVLMFDPFAPLRAGFWFSFSCVAVLLMLFVPRHGAMSAWRRVLMAQVGISLVMAPLCIYWFQQASLPGLLANLVAIPLVSVLVVPLILIALTLLWLPGPLAGWLLTVAGQLSVWLLLFLEQVENLQPSFLSALRTPGLLATGIAALGAAMFLLPRGIPLRVSGVLLLIPLLLPSVPSLDAGDTRIDMLDVGQGLSVLVNGRDQQLLYDTGPGNGVRGEDGWHLVDGTIRPMITASGNTPDTIVASHADLDHAGGLDPLIDAFPDARVIGSMPERRPGIEGCEAPARWAAGAHTFDILHPSAGLPYLGNASSCVLSVRGPGLSLFLGGDINGAVEKRLVLEGLAPHDVLVAPHHGSSSSSTHDLINAVRPGVALVSAALGNRYAFPHAEVLDRYTRIGVPVLDTAQCGAIRITADATGATRVQFARRERAAIWRYPAGPGCKLVSDLFRGI